MASVAELVGAPERDRQSGYLVMPKQMTVEGWGVKYAPEAINTATQNCSVGAEDGVRFLVVSAVAISRRGTLHQEQGGEQFKPPIIKYQSVTSL